MKKKESVKPWRGANQKRRLATKGGAFKTQYYVVDNIDPLGQGVAKDEHGITFIAKTLPGEKVSAQVIKRKKGVSFAILRTIEEQAGNRTKPECVHYEKCPGCHFMHTDYDSELSYKRKSLLRMLDKLNVDDSKINLQAAPKREGYRNRIQLHYRGGHIGLIDGLSDDIIEIPHCRIVRDELKPILSALYEGDDWRKDHVGEGHCELYLKNDAVSQEWDAPYAHGGFTQVFDEMNSRLRNSVTQYLERASINSLLDLFAGDGNLSQQVVENGKISRVMIDQAAQIHAKGLHHLDLYDENALKEFLQICREPRFDALLLDPPRKGFPALSTWVKTFKPKNLVYVSCNAATMVRDLLHINSKFVIDSVELLDLFPSTYHFETICFVSFKQ